MRAPAEPLTWGVASRPYPGQSRSGDAFLVRSQPDGLLVAVVDALGHGDDAASTAEKAIAGVERYAADPLPSLVKRCHAELLGSRGVVMGVAAFRLSDSSVEWLGIGNVEGVLVSADPRAQPRLTALVTRGGIVGADLPSLNPWVVPLNRGDTLVLSTDGIRPGFAVGVNAAESPQELADRVLSLFAKETDDALVLAIRWGGDT